MGASADGVRSEMFHTRVRHYCAHESAREVRLYTSYADANGVRLRVQSSDGAWRHVSSLYEIPGGWAWTMCQDCPVDGGRARRAGNE